MPEKDAVQKQKPGKSLPMRAILLAAQILLPFALYLFMQRGWLLGVYILAALIIVSMVMVIWPK